jgi:hypothetical protein
MIAAHSGLYAGALKPRSQKNPPEAPAAFGVSLAALGTIDAESRTEVERHQIHQSQNPEQTQSTYPKQESVRITEATPLVKWVKDGTEPPLSRFPTLADGDLVEPLAGAMDWHALPGAPVPDGKINAMLDYDFGSEFNSRDLSGVISRQPPLIRCTLPSRVPRVDRDGNETSGVSSIYLQVPLGTYTGWKLATAGYGRGGSCGFSGRFIAFARTRAERSASGDPRLSLEERYGDHAAFVAKVREAVARQMAEGWLLADDAQEINKAAEGSEVLQ